METDNPYKDFRTDQLAEMWLSLEVELTNLTRQQQGMAAEIKSRMEAEEAEDWEWPMMGPDGKPAAVTATISVDSSAWLEDKLIALKEYVSPDEWEELLTEQKPAPERKLDKRKVKALKKKGGAVRKAVEAAEPVAKKFKIKRS